MGRPLTGPNGPVRRVPFVSENLITGRAQSGSQLQPPQPKPSESACNLDSPAHASPLLLRKGKKGNS